MNNIDILYWGDWAGCGGETLEEEAEDTKLWFKTFIFEKKPFNFKLAKIPEEFEILSYDI